MKDESGFGKQIVRLSRYFSLFANFGAVILCSSPHHPRLIGSQQNSGILKGTFKIPERADSKSFAAERAPDNTSGWKWN
jgi:hypothetical protein